jgi:hypothetical protein
MLINFPSYFYYPNFDTAAAQYNEDKKQAFSIGEFLTFATTPSAEKYTGPVLVSFQVTHT